MDFDTELKARAKGETCPIPQGFETRLRGRLEALPQKRKHSRLTRWPLAAAAVAALCLGGVLATPAILEMARGTIAYFEIPAEFRHLSGQAEYEQFNSAVGMSATDNGLTVTVENISIDDTFLTLFYTITSEEPLPRVQDRHGSAEENVEDWLIGLKVRVDGQYLENWGRQIELHLVDDHTARVMERKPVMRVLPDVVELELYSDLLFFETPGRWYFALTVDKSAPAEESLVAEPNISFQMDGQRLTVEKVSVSPLGGGLVLHQVGSGNPFGGGPPPVTNFLLRDDRGNYLPQRWNGLVGAWYGISNFIEIYGGRTDMERLTLVPYAKADREAPDAYPVVGPLLDMPLTDGAEDGYTMIFLEIEGGTATAVFTARGITPYLPQEGPDFLLLDEAGRYAQLNGAGYTHSDFDRETGLYTVTLSYPDATEREWAAVRQVMLWQPNPYVLLEDQAVTIPLK